MKHLRAIPTLEGKIDLLHLLDGRYENRENAINKCYEAALFFGYDVFAVQNGGWCGSSATAKQAYQYYGKSSKCKQDGKGGPWANEVYQIVARKGIIVSEHSKETTKNIC